MVRHLWFLVPLAFITMTLVFDWLLAVEPFRGTGDVGWGIGNWLLGSLVLSVPYLLASVVFLAGRWSILIRVTTLCYIVAAGVMGLFTNIWVLNSDSSTSPIALVVVLATQLFTLGPLSLMAATLVWGGWRGWRMVRLRHHSVGHGA